VVPVPDTMLCTSIASTQQQITIINIIRTVTVKFNINIESKICVDNKRPSSNEVSQDPDPYRRSPPLDPDGAYLAGPCT